MDTVHDGLGRIGRVRSGENRRWPRRGGESANPPSRRRRRRVFQSRRRRRIGGGLPDASRNTRRPRRRRRSLLDERQANLGMARNYGRGRSSPRFGIRPRSTAQRNHPARDSRADGAANAESRRQRTRRRDSARTRRSVQTGGIGRRRLAGGTQPNRGTHTAGVGQAVQLADSGLERQCVGRRNPARTGRLAEIGRAASSFQPA